jgi:hypothetical protein
VPFPYRVKVTVPVGFGTDAGVPAVLVTVASSWTTVPAGTVLVMSLFDGSRTLVAMLESAQFLLAFPLPPEEVFAAVPVVRVIVCPLAGMPEVAETTVVPAIAEVIVTVQLAVAAPPK